MDRSNVGITIRRHGCQMHDGAKALVLVEEIGKFHMPKCTRAGMQMGRAGAHPIW